MARQTKKVMYVSQNALVKVQKNDLDLEQLFQA